MNTPPNEGKEQHHIGDTCLKAWKDYVDGLITGTQVIKITEEHQDALIREQLENGAVVHYTPPHPAPDGRWKKEFRKKFVVEEKSQVPSGEAFVNGTAKEVINFIASEVSKAQKESYTKGFEDGKLAND